jgi:hypothetical protein
LRRLGGEKYNAYGGNNPNQFKESVEGCKQQNKRLYQKPFNFLLVVFITNSLLAII